jgi:GT2 family glycosyltransferase
LETTDILCSIVIVNYNGRHLLNDCLTSVLSQEHGSFEVILVDNGSTDDSVSYVTKHFPAVHTIASQTNLGFAGGSNLGVKGASGSLICLLNNDTVVQPGWLRTLATAVSPEDVAVAGSLVLTKGIPKKYYEKNGSLNFVGHNIMLVFEKPENIFYAGGASLIFKKNVLGIPFDADYFAYGEDVYLGLRARFMGYRVVHVNDSRVLHAGGATTSKVLNTRMRMIQERNRLLNMFLFFSVSTVLRLVPLFIMNFITKMVVASVSASYSLLAVLWAHLWIVFHIPTFTKKRKVLRRQFTVDEQDIISWMTARVANGETTPGMIANALSTRYCRLVGLKTIESMPAGTR